MSKLHLTSVTSGISLGEGDVFAHHLSLSWTTCVIGSSRDCRQCWSGCISGSAGSANFCCELCSVLLLPEAELHILPESTELRENPHGSAVLPAPLNVLCSSCAGLWVVVSVFTRLCFQCLQPLGDCCSSWSSVGTQRCFSCPPGGCVGVSVGDTVCFGTLSWWRRCCSDTVTVGPCQQLPGVMCQAGSAAVQPHCCSQSSFGGYQSLFQGFSEPVHCTFPVGWAACWEFCSARVCTSVLFCLHYSGYSPEPTSFVLQTQLCHLCWR